MRNEEFAFRCTINLWPVCEKNIFFGIQDDRVSQEFFKLSEICVV